MMRTCETSGCENAANNGGLCAECLRREYPMLEEMTMKALRLAVEESDSARAISSP